MRITENKRQQIVDKFSKLIYLNNRELNDLMTLAVDVCKVPIVLVTLMHEKTQVIKCKIGIDIDELSRDDTFCRYMKIDEVMVVPNTLNDSRFINNPAVTGELGIRFYAGAPLVTSARVHIGSFCIADQKPHSFSDHQKDMLAILSRQVMFMLELQMSLNLIQKQNETVNLQRKKSAESERKIRGFFNSTADCHILIGKDYKIIDFNKSTQSHLRRFNKIQIKNGQNIKQFVDKKHVKGFIKYFELALNGQSTGIEVLLNTGLPTWWEVCFQPVLDKNGNVDNIAYSAANIDERKKHLAQITSRNQSLLAVAHIQSHEYRRPVASILGLINVIKAENYKPDKQCLIMLEVAAKELDSKLKEVVNHIHDLA